MNPVSTVQYVGIGDILASNWLIPHSVFIQKIVKHGHIPKTLDRAQRKFTYIYLVIEQIYQIYLHKYTVCLRTLINILTCMYWSSCLYRYMSLVYLFPLILYIYVYIQYIYIYILDLVRKCRAQQKQLFQPMVPAKNIYNKNRRKGNLSSSTRKAANSHNTIMNSYRLLYAVVSCNIYYGSIDVVLFIETPMIMQSCKRYTDQSICCFFVCTVFR